MGDGVIAPIAIRRAILIDLNPLSPKLPAPGEAVMIRVFLRGAGGGNPVPLLVHADGMSPAQHDSARRSDGLSFRDWAAAFHSPQSLRQ